MKHILPLLSLALLNCFPPKGWAQHTLKEAFADDFLVGAAIDYGELRDTSAVLHRLIRNEFSTLVCVNSMKADHTELREGIFHFAGGDAVVDYAERNGQVVTGHCLVWHSQCPSWMFGPDSTGRTVDREMLIRRMRNHIYGVCGHYRGKVKGWDVVNEAIEGDGSWRKSEYYRILGDEFIVLAFQFAHEADPDARATRTGSVDPFTNGWDVYTNIIPSEISSLT